MQESYVSASLESETEFVSQDELSSALQLNGSCTGHTVPSRSEADEHRFQFGVTESESEAGFLESDMSDDLGGHLQRHMRPRPNVSASRSARTNSTLPATCQTSQTLTQSTLNSSCSSDATSASSQTLKTLKFEDIDFKGDARKRRPEVNNAESVETMRRDVDTVDISVCSTTVSLTNASKQQIINFRRSVACYQSGAFQHGSTRSANH